MALLFVSLVGKYAPIDSPTPLATTWVATAVATSFLANQIAAVGGVRDHETMLLKPISPWPTMASTNPLRELNPHAVKANPKDWENVVAMTIVLWKIVGNFYAILETITVINLRFYLKVFIKY